MSALAAVLTTFFDVADHAYLPTVVERRDLVRANGALAATSSAMEFVAFGVAGFLVNLLTAPIAIAIDALSFVVSALLLGSIRRPEPPPPPVADREPVLDEIREGLRLVVRDPVLRGLAWGTMGLAAMWGVFGATWLLFVTDELHLDPAVIGVVAALGGFGSLLGAVFAERAVRRFGLGPVVVASLLFAALGNLLIPLAPPGLPLVAIACLIGQQLIGDTAVTVFDVTETSVRQVRVGDRQLGRVNATVRVAMVMAQLGGTLLGGLFAEIVGLRAAAFLAPVFALLGAWAMFASPVRGLRSLSPAPAVVDSVEQRLDEAVGVERQEVVGLLPHPDEADRDAEVVLDREHDPALGRRVELGEHDAGQADGLVERLGLGQAVLAGRGIEDEERVDVGAGQALVDDAAHLRELLHQVRLGVEAAGGVGDDDVRVAGDRGVERVEHDGGRVGVRGVGHDLAVRALGPDPELVDRRGAERVGGGEDDPPALRPLPGGELADASWSCRCR